MLHHTHKICIFDQNISNMAKQILLYLSCIVLLTSCSSSNNDNESDGPGSSTHVKSVSLWNGEGIHFQEANQQKELEFIVSPKTDDLLINIASTDCQVHIIDEKGEMRGISPDDDFLITGIRLSLENSNTPTGRYTITLTNNSRSNLGYTLNARIAVASAQETATSYPFAINYLTDNNEVASTGLPVVMINTPGAQTIDSKEVWTADVEMKIYTAEGELDYEGTLAMKGRGNTTWWYPKRPYALKLDSKSEILGMKKHKRWCLLANYIDRTLMRNAVAFEVSRCTDLPYTPKGQFVELLLNGEYQGNYYLTEQIKVDKNRVDIAELEDATEGEDITGGYIFELDTYFDEQNKFYSTTFGMPWQFKDPDEVNSAQIQYVKNYVAQMEMSLTGENLKAHAYNDYIDIDTFIDYWYVYELTTNGEPGHPKSVYMVKDKNGKMQAGPVWDFDWGTFSTWASTTFVIKDAVYYGALFSDPQFTERVKSRWQLLKSRFETIPEYIETLRLQIAASNSLNHKKWGCPEQVNEDAAMDFNRAVDLLKRNYIAKLNWLDSTIPTL